VTSTSVLGEFEQLVLLAVLQCGAEAYGVPVWREIEARTGREVSLAAVYKTLLRLESKGCVASGLGAPTAQRGGRGKRVYRMTGAGLRLLRVSLASLARMTEGLQEVLPLNSLELSIHQPAGPKETGANFDRSSGWHALSKWTVGLKPR
jgi:PadR family transcriptional regulator, regulatory protein PadR